MSDFFISIAAVCFYILCSVNVKISQENGTIIFAWDHVRDHAHFCHGAFFRAFDQVALHTAVEGVVAALQTAPGASQAL